MYTRGNNDKDNRRKLGVIYEGDLKCFKNRQEMAPKVEMDSLADKGNLFFLIAGVYCQ